MFRVENISKTFKGELFQKDFVALDNVSFEVRPGVATGFLGANGAGKTTFMKILMGFIKSDFGEIIFNKKLGEKRSEIIKKFGYVPERPYFHQHLTGREFLTYMGKLSNIENKILGDTVNDLAPRLSIDFALDREIKGYSKGMLQRLGFLSALLHDPEILVLDEPLSGLDPVGRRDLKVIMQELVDEGKSLFVSSHIIPDIEELCEDVVVLERGSVRYQGNINELLSKSESGDVNISYYSGSTREVRKVSVDSVNEVLAELISNDYRIDSVEPNRMKLEEIIYKLD